VFSWLTSWGHEVFFDRDKDRGISVGEDWKRRLYRELGRVDAVVCVVTRAYLESMWCTAEVAIADSRGCRLLPLRFEPALMHKLMERVQYAGFDADHQVAREQLRVTLQRLDADGATWREGENPYPGLKPFGADRSRLFFGRALEIRSLAARLRAEDGRRMLVVVGPSGCGKSSLLQAGLLPLLRDDSDWLVLDPWQPRGDPLRQLAVKLVKAGRPGYPNWSPGELRERLGRDGGLRDLAEELLDGRPEPAGRLLIAIDQAEQLFTGAVGAAHAAALGAALGGAIAGPVRVVATLRSEFLDDLTALPYLTGLTTEVIATQLLGPLSPDMLRLAIEKPASIAGLRLEPELVARLLADTSSGEALPLLASALEELAEGRGPGDRIGVADYDALGARHGYDDLAGVHAVLARRADRTLDAAATAGRWPAQQVLAGLVRLVTLDEAGRRARRRIDGRALPAPLRAAFGVFVDNRLLTSDNGWIEVAHEALLTAWPPLDQAITERGDALRAARSVEQAAADWAGAGRVDGYLWDDERYSATALALGLPAATLPSRPMDHMPSRTGRMVHRLRQRNASEHAPAGRAGEQVVEIEPRAREFLTASGARILARRQRERRRARRTVTVLSVFLALALVASGVAGLQWLSAKEERDAATVRGLLARADEVRATDPQLALRLALAARAVGAGGLAEEYAANLLNTLTQNNYAATLTGHTSSVFAAAFSPNGRVLATGDADDHTVLLWDVADPARPQRLGAPLTDHTYWVLAAAFSPDGHTLATASSQELILWDVTDPAQPRRRAVRAASVEQGNEDSLGLAFTPDGHTLATTAMGALTLWDVSDPDDPRQLGEPLLRGIERLSDVAIGSGGVLAVAANDQLGLWNIADPKRPTLLSLEPGLGGLATSVAFVPFSATLAVGSGNGTVTLFDVDEPAIPRTIGGKVADAGGPDLRKVRIHPTRPIMAVTSDDAVRMWDLTDPASPRRAGELTDHTNSVYAVAFSPTGHAMATASADNKVILWGAYNTVQPTVPGPPLIGHTDQINAIAFGPDSDALVTGGDDGLAVLWDLRNPAAPGRHPLVGKGDDINAVAFDPLGKSVATGGADRAVILWDVTDTRNPRQRAERLIGYTDGVVTVAFSRDGRYLASADSNVTLIWWDLTDPARPSQAAESLRGRIDFQPMVVFSPDWLTLASGHGISDGVVLRDITDPDNVRLLGQEFADNIRSLAFRPDGRILVISNWNPGVSLMNIADPAQPRLIGQPLPGPLDGAALAFSPDGQTLAVGGSEGTTLWNLGDPERPHRLGDILYTDRTVTALTFSPDGRTLATGDSSGDVRPWDLTALVEMREHLVERACERARRGLTAEEWGQLVGPDQEYRDTCPGGS